MVHVDALISMNTFFVQYFHKIFAGIANTLDPDQTWSALVQMHFVRKGGVQNFTLIAICRDFNPCPAEPGYALSLQTMQIQISWLLKKPTDLDLHCLPFSI